MSVTLTAFSGPRRIASGSCSEVLALLRQRHDESPPFVFDDCSGERLDLDLRFPSSVTAQTPLHEPPPESARGVGRPRLGVVAREVTLLPRHWDWLNRQPGGASVALRRLIDEARHTHAQRDAVRAAREAAYRFMLVMAGDLPGFEEAARALFAGERSRFESYTATWPPDVRSYLTQLAQNGWSTSTT